MKVVYKTFYIDIKKYDNVLKRIIHVQNTRPANVAPWKIDLEQKVVIQKKKYIKLTLVRPFLIGHSLDTLSNYSVIDTSLTCYITQKIWQSVMVWSLQGFVHGDLSPSNIILVSKSCGAKSIVFIDWLLDPMAPSGTPHYTKPSYFSVKFSAEKDQYAALKIYNEIQNKTSQFNHMKFGMGHKI